MLLCLIDDEDFDVRDREAARLYFHRVRADEAPQLNATNSDARVHCCLNLTTKHFTEGAVTFENMTPEGDELLCSWFNALAHATDQKQVSVAKKNTRQQQQQLASSTASLNQSQGIQRQKKGKKKHKKRRTRDGEMGTAGSDSEESTADADEDDSTHSSSSSDQAADERMDGALHLGVFIETLFDQQWRVVGYRFHAFDASAHRTRVDLLTRGMRRSLQEGHELQEQIKTELARLRRTGATQNSNKRNGNKTYEANPRYRWAQRETEEQYLSVVRGYFLADSLYSAMQPRSLTQTMLDRLIRDPELEAMADDEQSDEDERLARLTRPVFTDTRPFMQQQQQQPMSLHGSGVGLQARRLDMPQLFSFEQSMVYHVEQANVRLEQRTPMCYYSPFSGRVEKELERLAAVEQERHQKHDRLDRLIRERREDQRFHHFPYPHTTYKIDQAALSMEVMRAMPLPHRIGITPYNQAHRVQVQNSVRRARQDPADDDEEDLLDERIAQRPLGLHDVMTDVTPGLLHKHRDLIQSDELRQHLTTRHVPLHLAQGFLSSIRNTVQRELNSIQATLREPKNDLVETRIGQQVVPPATVQFHQLFKTQTQPGVVDTSHKQHMLERRIGMEVGQTEDTQMREREKALARADINFFRSRLGKWRPTNTTLETVIQHCQPLKHEEWAIEQDYALASHCLNDLGYSKLRRKYLDPATGQIRASQMAQYRRERREYMEAILVEFWEHFFTVTRAKTSHANCEIRKDLQRDLARRGYYGRHVTEFPFDVQARIYHQYKLQLYKYFSDHAGITHHYKIMDTIWHAARHHCRYYQPGCKDCKLSPVMGGDGDVGKSFRLAIVKEASPPGVCETISRTTDAALLTGKNFNDYLIINEEMSANLVGAATDGKGASDPRGEDARNVRKEVMTAQQTSTMAYHQDDEGNRTYNIHHSMCQSTTVGATNANMSRMDQSLASRYIILAVAGQTGLSEGTSAHEKERPQDGQSRDLTRHLLEQKRYENEVYYMVELLIRAGVMEDAVFGVEVAGGRFLINKVLDQLAHEHNIPTHKPRKRKHVLEMARVLCIASTVWYVLVAPELRHLQHDPVTGAFIGLNPRVLLAIIDRLVVTTDHVVDALTMLSSLWSHDYQDSILENFAVRQCKLDDLRQKDFIHREGMPESMRDALDAAPLMRWTPRTNRHQQPQQQPAWSLTHGVTQDTSGSSSHNNTTTAPITTNIDHKDWDYNYIVMSAKDFLEIHRRLSQTDSALRVSLQDVDRMLTTLANTTITCDAYEPLKDKDGHVMVDRKTGNIQRLVRSPGRYKERRVLDKGKDANGFDAYAISVAYLKRKLPHRLPDTRIQNLDVPDEQDSFLRLRLDEEEEREMDSDDEEARDLMNEGRMRLIPDELAHQQEQARQESQLQDSDASMLDLRQRLQQALCIERGDANETVVIKAIREVLEYDTLGWTGRAASVEEEESLMTGRHEGSYGDVLTGESPCSSYATSEHPLPLPTEAVFGDLATSAYHTSGGKASVTQAISMVDMPATITLKRNPQRPLIDYNYMTVSELTKASLPIYQQQHGMGDDHEGLERERDDGLLEGEHVVQTKRVQMYSECPVFRYDKDIDYTYCKKHLTEMGCPQPVDANGRMINYPPDQYCAMIDYRDEQERRTGVRRNFVPPYTDVLHRIKVKRQQLQVRQGDLSKATAASLFVSADYDAADMRAYDAQFCQAALKRRQPTRPATERQDALKELYDLTENANTVQAWKPLKPVSAVSAISHQTGRTEKSTSRRARKT